jgi:plastocyanin
MVLGGLLLAGCGGDDSASSGSNGTGGTPADVVVHGTDDLKFDQASYTAKAGSQSIELINDGGQPHTLVIDKQKFDKLEVSKKGDSDRGTATLPPGTYTIYCDIVGHRSAGMEAKLVVN